jgi:hypothetical protein
MLTVAGWRSVCCDTSGRSLVPRRQASDSLGRREIRPRGNQSRERYIHREPVYELRRCRAGRDFAINGSLLQTPRIRDARCSAARPQDLAFATAGAPQHRCGSDPLIANRWLNCGAAGRGAISRSMDRSYKTPAFATPVAPQRAHRTSHSRRPLHRSAPTGPRLRDSRCSAAPLWERSTDREPVAELRCCRAGRDFAINGSLLQTPRIRDAHCTAARPQDLAFATAGAPQRRCGSDPLIANRWLNCGAAGRGVISRSMDRSYKTPAFATPVAPQRAHRTSHSRRPLHRSAPTGPRLRDTRCSAAPLWERSTDRESVAELRRCRAGRDFAIDGSLLRKICAGVAGAACGAVQQQCALACVVGQRRGARNSVQASCSRPSRSSRSPRTPGSRW